MPILLALLLTGCAPEADAPSPATSEVRDPDAPRKPVRPHQLPTSDDDRPLRAQRGGAHRLLGGQEGEPVFGGQEGEPAPTDPSDDADLAPPPGADSDFDSDTGAIEDTGLL